jgi:lysophospholipase L1-like esterase
MSLPVFKFSNLNVTTVNSDNVNSNNVNSPIINSITIQTDVLKKESDEKGNSLFKISAANEIKGLECWIDASDAFTIETTGGKVTKIYDKSGKNNHFIEKELNVNDAIKVNNITYIPEGEANDSTLSNIGLLDFNYSRPLEATISEGSKESDYCYFVVAQIKGDYSFIPAQVASIIFGRSTGNRVNLFYDRLTVNGLSVGAVNTGISGLGEHKSRKIIFMIYKKGAAPSELYLNGAYIRNRGTTRTTNKIQLGSDINTDMTNFLYYNGYIAEVILFNRALDNTELRAVHDYLAIKWDVYQPRIVDYFTIAGQSNAVGRGDISESPLSQSGYYVDACWSNALIGAFKKTAINWIRDPVGVGGTTLDIADTGSAWPSFADEYFKQTGRYAVFGHCAKGGTSIFNVGQWSPDNKANNFINFAKEVLKNNLLRIDQEYRFKLDKKFIIWHQGESDVARTKDEYRVQFKLLIDEFIGKYGGYDKFLYYEIAPRTSNTHINIREAQREVNNYLKNTHMLWNGCAYLLEKGEMPDGLHYSQRAYNAMGREGAKATAILVKKNNFEKPSLGRFTLTPTWKAYGDSFTTGVGSQSSTSWASRLATITNTTVINQASANSLITHMSGIGVSYNSILKDIAYSNNSIIAYGFNDYQRDPALTLFNDAHAWQKVYTDAIMTLAMPTSNIDDARIFQVDNVANWANLTKVESPTYSYGIQTSVLGAVVTTSERNARYYYFSFTASGAPEDRWLITSGSYTESIKYKYFTTLGSVLSYAYGVFIDMGTKAKRQFTITNNINDANSHGINYMSYWDENTENMNKVLCLGIPKKMTFDPVDSQAFLLKRTLFQEAIIDSVNTCRSLSIPAYFLNSSFLFAFNADDTHWTDSAYINRAREIKDYIDG